LIEQQRKIDRSIILSIIISAINIMEQPGKIIITEELVVEIAKGRVISDLCLKYYSETNPATKKEIFKQIELYQDVLFK